MAHESKSKFADKKKALKIIECQQPASLMKDNIQEDWTKNFHDTYFNLSYEILKS